MKTQTVRKLLSLCFLTIFISACGGTASTTPARPEAIAAEKIADIIAKYQAEIPQVMQQEHIPGLAIAVVDDKGVLWQQGFGYTDLDRRTPITPSTLFPIQSMSKSFTATAAMFAAQDGLVDLDAPITTYLPNFTVHSIFEEQPERKITLRMLLSHTAGFPYETSYGNNNDRPPEFSFEKHIASISDSWLMSPVGTRYSYSNNGIDLAGYILQERSGMPFIQYMQQKVLDPLGMKDSTLDFQRVRATSTRSFGHGGDPINLRPPVDLLIIPSGGVWTTAEDMARYLQFHINGGRVNGTRLLTEDLLETMLTPPNLAAMQANPPYALGVYSYHPSGARYVQHGGGGFGSTNYMAWYPDLKLGAVVLSNAITPKAYAVSLCENVLNSIITSDIPLYHQRDLDAVPVAPAYPPDTKGAALPDAALQTLVESKALPGTQPEGTEYWKTAQKRLSSYAGTYILWGRGFPADTFAITFSNSRLAYTHQGGEAKVNLAGALTEVNEGLLVSDSGSTFDLRGPVPRIDNFRVVKAAPQALPFKITLYAICGLLFLAALFAWPVGTLFWRSRRVNEKNGQAQAADTARKDSPWLILIGALAGLASLFSLFCLAIIALMPNMVYFPWPQPWSDLLWWQAAIFRLPFAGLTLGVVLGLLAVLGLRGQAGPRAARWFYIAVGMAALIFNSVILI